MKNEKLASRLFGIFYLLAFVSYGFGSGLVDSVIASNDILKSLHSDSTGFTIGVVLMAIVHTFVTIGAPVVILPTLKRLNPKLAYGYFSGAVAATITLMFGAILLMTLLPLSSLYSSATGDLAHFDTLVTLITKTNYYAYNTGMAIWGLAGLLFCQLLYTSKIVPRALSIWGYIGYICFTIGTIAEISGWQIGIIAAIPGGLFEVTISIWLIAKGMNTNKISKAI